jgi:quinol monooxygenase YgiN
VFVEQRPATVSESEELMFFFKRAINSFTTSGRRHDLFSGLVNVGFEEALYNFEGFTTQRCAYEVNSSNSSSSSSRRRRRRSSVFRLAMMARQQDGLSLRGHGNTNEPRCRERLLTSDAEGSISIANDNDEAGSNAHESNGSSSISSNELPYAETEDDISLDEQQAPTVAEPVFLMLFIAVDDSGDKPLDSFFEMMNNGVGQGGLEEGNFNHFILQRYDFPEKDEIKKIRASSSLLEAQEYIREQADTHTSIMQGGRDTKKQGSREAPEGIRENVKLHTRITASTNSLVEANESGASSTAIRPSCNFMVHAGFDSSDVMERHMNRKSFSRAFEKLVLHQTVASSPLVVTTWHRCNLDGINYDHHSYKPVGRFFVRRTRYIRHDAPRAQILETLEDVASLIVSDVYASETVVFGQQNNKVVVEEEDGDGEADTTTLRERRNHEEGGCVSYDILFSDNRYNRFDEIVEWSSWTSKEAYQREQEKADSNPAIQYCFQFVDSFSHLPLEVTFWQTHPKMPL